ncbi:MAG: tetratricopeptide repeat protein [Motiliproteus sp.]|nr:tetratricopeptide repeat protein [Motiliproteus sp.]MCW9052496.1 tetratricopeptide repeat protein [Motiliproteus sp.]
MENRTAALMCLFLGLSSTSLQAQTNLPVPVVDRAPTVTATNPQNAAATQVRRPSHNAEMLMMVDQLQEEVRYLRGQLEEMSHQLKKMRTNQRDRYRDLDRRITSINRQMAETPPSSSLVPLTPAVTEPAPSATPTTASASPEAAVTPPAISDRQAYKEAFELVRQRSFDEALSAFDNFVQVYPNSILVANVLYWTGEIHSKKQQPDHTQAQQAYTQLVERFPDHQRTPDAYYKRGLIYHKEGDIPQAKAMMNKVIATSSKKTLTDLASQFLAKNP